MAVLTLSQSEQHEALLRRQNGQLRFNRKSGTERMGLSILPVAGPTVRCATLTVGSVVVAETLVPGL